MSDFEIPGNSTGGGQVNSVVAGTGVSVDATDPVNPIVNLATHTHTASDVSDFSTAADARIAAAAGVSVASLSGGKVPSAQLPAIALTDVFTVASQAAQLALTAEEGDVAIRTDLNKSYIHNGGVAGTMADWSELLTPTDAVLSVDSTTGAIDLATILFGKTAKTTPVDADTVSFTDSAASNVLKKVTWANIKTTLGSTFAALAGSVSQAFSASTLELGHASDTTLSRVSAGVIAVEGVTVPTISSTNTLTNKRITARTGTTTSHATPTINTDNVDIFTITAQAEAITSMTTNLSGTPTDGQKLMISVTGTAARAITWGASFENGPVALPTTTVTTTRLDVFFVWNATTSKWRCMASGSTV